MGVCVYSARRIVFTWKAKCLNVEHKVYSGWLNVFDQGRPATRAARSTALDLQLQR